MLKNILKIIIQQIAITLPNDDEGIQLTRTSRYDIR